MATAYCTQLHFRGRDDSQILNSSTFTYGLDTNWSQKVDEVFRVRFEAEEQNSKNFTVGGQLQYSYKGGAWNSVTTISSYIKAVNSAQFSDNSATTNIIAGSSRTFVDGTGSTDGLASSVGLNNSHTEIEYSLQIVGTDVAQNDTIQLRIESLTDWAQTPTITIKVPVNTFSNKPAYLKGNAKVNNNKSSFLHGYNTLVSSKSVYFMAGYLSPPSNKHVYLFSIDYGLSNKSAFTIGIDNIIYPNNFVGKIGTWKNEIEEIINLYNSIDESIPDDNDYIWDIDPTTDNYIEFNLSSPGGNPESGDVIIFWKGRDKSNSGHSKATIELKQGGTIIAYGEQILTSFSTLYYIVLTPEQVATITNWDDLRIKIIITII
jgi:hypothetical protein